MKGAKIGTFSGILTVTNNVTSTQMPTEIDMESSLDIGQNRGRVSEKVVGKRTLYALSIGNVRNTSAILVDNAIENRN